MFNTTLIASVTDIGVAGVIGSMATAWATRRANRRQFERDQAAKRRSDVRDLIDEASVLLAAGAMNLPLSKEAAQATTSHRQSATGQRRSVFSSACCSVCLKSTTPTIRLPMTPRATFARFQGI